MLDHELPNTFEQKDQITIAQISELAIESIVAPTVPSQITRTARIKALGHELLASLGEQAHHRGSLL